MNKKEVTTKEMVSKSNENQKNVRMDRRTFVKLAGLGAGALAFGGLSSKLASASAQVLQTPLDPTTIPKYVDPLPVFGPAGSIPRVPAAGTINVSMEVHSQQVLSTGTPLAGGAIVGTGVGLTGLWAYNVGGITNYPAVTLEATRGTPVIATYTNNLTPDLYRLITVDKSLHWANPLNEPMVMGDTSFYTGEVPACVHLHGGEVESASDGGPDTWFTPGNAITGPAWAQGATNVCTYPNNQEAATIWFHDHALGATRLNVYAGMAGFYFIRDPANERADLPGGAYEIEMAIQDKMFDDAGQLFFPDIGINPMVHPYWIPEFFGDTIVVNGKTWPYLNVEGRRYRFRLVNGSNARFYNLSFGGMTFYQIGTDGGLMNAPVALTSLLMGPGERADIIVDFAGQAGNNIIVTNDAGAPFSPGGGTAPDPATTGQIMQFRVGAVPAGGDTSYNPQTDGSPRAAGTTQLLTNSAGALAAGVTPNVIRRLTLNEVMGMGGPLEVLENNTKWAASITENPVNGETEVWEIVNLTADTHPIHLHLVQFQLLNRQALALDALGVPTYSAAYAAAFPGGVYVPGGGPPLPYLTPVGGAIGGNPDIAPHLTGPIIPPDQNELGWKDTVRMNPGQVTRIAVRWMPTDIAAGAAGSFTTIDPTTGPGYVWHCHIVDHEDNEMMRPFTVSKKIVPPPPPIPEMNTATLVALGAIGLAGLERLSRKE